MKNKYKNEKETTCYVWSKLVCTVRNSKFGRIIKGGAAEAGCIALV